jgi:soluble lytic murein transglycosylase-like protein
VCRDQEIISLLILKSLERGIPTNLLFALVQQESGFDPKALNDRNENGSEDIGLMQLNTRKFKQKKVQLYDLKTNVDLGTSHLIDLKNKYNSWEEAIMRYNGWGDKAVTHLSNVLRRERDIDRLYNSY